MKAPRQLEVCSDCAQMSANGPHGAEFGEGFTERYAAAVQRFGDEPVLTHNPEDEGDGYWFSWSPCGFCGDPLGGNRLSATLLFLDKGGEDMEDTDNAETTCAECGGAVSAVDGVATDAGLAFCGDYYGNGCWQKLGY